MHTTLYNVTPLKNLHSALQQNQPFKTLLTRETPGNRRRGPGGGAIPVERPGWRRWRGRPPGSPTRLGPGRTPAENNKKRFKQVLYKQKIPFTCENIKKKTTKESPLIKNIANSKKLTVDGTKSPAWLSSSWLRGKL